VTHVVVVGAGISGLAAAYRLRRLLPDARVTVVDQASRAGGKLHTASLAGVPLDIGAETFLVRRPEAVDLVRELGLEASLVHPGPVAARLRFDGRLAPLPPRTLLGVPAAVDGLDAVLSPSGLATVRAESSLPPLDWLPSSDVAVGPLVARRLGPEVAARLVDPLLGGVYAGRADALGLRPTMPQLAAALDDAVRDGRPPSLLTAAAAALGLPPSTAQLSPAPATPAASGNLPAAPVFGALRGGMSVLVDALVKAARAELRLGLPVRKLERTPRGWRLEIGSAAEVVSGDVCQGTHWHSRASAAVDADAVILAVPPPSLRRLLAPLHPAASAAAAGVDVASMVIVSLALPPGTELPRSSGVLVAAGEPLHAKAFTYSSAKWPHLGGDGPVLLRASLGRYGEAHTLRAEDTELIRRVRDDLAELTGITAEPIDAAVTRWGGGLPQYAVGHLDRVAAIEAAAAALPALAVAGAALHGVGIPACIATADAAARRIARGLSFTPA
jgi:protoporphyrinogen/coproporphyrinogen III oxidase